MIRFLNFSVVVVILSGNILNAQAPETLWTRIFFNYAPFEGYSIRSTIDSGFAVCGVGCAPLGCNSAFLLKVNSNGDSLWAQTLWAPYGSTYNCMSISSNGKIAVGGWFRSFTGGQQSWCEAYSNDGNRVGGVNLLMGNQDNQVRGVDWTSDGGLIIADDPMSPGPYHDIRIIKSDSSWNIQWTRLYGGANDETPGAVKPDIQSGYIIAGTTASFGAGGADAYLVRIDANGDTLWTKTYGGSSTDSFLGIEQTPDSGYLAIGSTWSFGNGGSDIYAVRTNSYGDTIWTRTYGTSDNQLGYSVDKVPSGGYIICGVSMGSAYLVRINENGDTLWTKTFDQYPSNNALSIIALPDGGFAFTGHIYDASPEGLWIVRLAPEAVCITDIITPIPGELSMNQNYPNPFNFSTAISFYLPEASMTELAIYNILGEREALLIDGYHSAGNRQVIWDASAFSSGLYVARLKSAGQAKSIKLLLMK